MGQGLPLNLRKGPTSKGKRPDFLLVGEDIFLNIIIIIIIIIIILESQKKQIESPGFGKPCVACSIQRPPTTCQCATDGGQQLWNGADGPNSKKGGRDTVMSWEISGYTVYGYSKKKTP